MRPPLLLAILAVLPSCQTIEGEGCMIVAPEATECPARKHVEPSDLFLRGECGDDLKITEIRGGGSLVDLNEGGAGATPACCYPVYYVDLEPGIACIVGRPYFDGATSIVAPLVNCALEDRVAEPTEAAQRGNAWALAGAAEHASVAAFSRLALQLLALGAPNALVAGVHQAALDELRHADTCWSLAQRFTGTEPRAGAFPFGAAAAGPISLAELAAATVREGCLAETLGAYVAQAAAELAPEEEVRRELATIAAEEATHAVLSFRIVAWALQTGGDDVRRAVHAALTAPCPRLDIAELALRTQVDVALLQQAAEQGVEQVLRPATQRLLAA